MMGNRTTESPKYFDDRFADQTQMSDAKLDDHIKTLKHSAHQYKVSWGEDDATLLAMLRMATDEKNSRSVAKQVEASNNLARETLNLTKKTIILWWTAIALATISIVIAIFK